MKQEEGESREERRRGRGGSILGGVVQGKMEKRRKERRERKKEKRGKRGGSKLGGGERKKRERRKDEEEKLSREMKGKSQPEGDEQTKCHPNAPLFPQAQQRIRSRLWGIYGSAPISFLSCCLMSLLGE